MTPTITEAPIKPTTKPVIAPRPKLIGLEAHKRAILAAMRASRPTLLIGGAATGKSTLAQECAFELGRRYYRVNLNGFVTPDQLIGRMMARANGGTDTFFQYGILVRAMREGAVLILDEVNAALPDTLFCLHAVLERMPRLYVPETEEEVLPKDGFCVIGTMNPAHEYAGTRELNAAFMSRFDVVRRFNDLEGAPLVEALKQHTPEGICDQTILDVAELLADIRKARKEDRIQSMVTLRECISALQLMCELGKAEALESAVFSKLDELERKELKFTASTTIPSGKTLAQLFADAQTAEALSKQVKQLQSELEALGKLREVMQAFTAKEGGVA